ncbi:hypothetical protein B0A55_04164 [Friedmanniomyces simplex]|uniref:Uncharacterized protein n=1 Tax=Friedmanniomyces simplex TaxID=329884 RepID=A0A4U0XYG9_9PEZI|nr:hypothetical protein B0A55_04164 [Friedmanniomyces simplex]
MRTPITTKQQAAALQRKAPRPLLPHPSASPVSNPHRISANSKVTKEEALADKASPREPQLNDARSGAQILTKDRNEAAVTGSSRPAPSAISHSHPLGHGRNQSSTVGASTERSSIATFDASSSATITSGLQPRHRYYYDAKETLRIWEMYWDAHFKPINRNARLQRRVDLHNKWRLENGYGGTDRTWAGMEQRIFKLRARGVTIEEMRARAAASEGGHTATAMDEKEVGTDDAATQARSVHRKLFGTNTIGAPKRGADGHPRLTFVDVDFGATDNPQRTAEARAHTARNIHRRLQTRTADPQTSSAHRSSNAQPDPSLMIAEEQRRKQMEDQKDIVTAGTVVQVLDTLINHARNIKGVSRKDIEFALQQGVQDYVAKASKRNPEFAREWREGQIAGAETEMTTTMKKNAEQMAERKQQVEKMAERRKHAEKMAKRRQQAEKMEERKQQAEAEAARTFEPIDHNDPPWKHWR